LLSENLGILAQKSKHRKADNDVVGYQPQGAIEAEMRYQHCQWSNIEIFYLM
jgi:hypothetical protein